MKLKHATAHTVSIGGQTYEGEGGVFEVPDEHGPVLVESHGFEIVPTPEASAKPEEPERRGKRERTRLSDGDR